MPALEPDRGVVTLAGGGPQAVGCLDAEPHDHAVLFYEQDDELVSAVVTDVAQGLRDGAAVVVATPAHRRAVEARLEAAGFDLAAHRRVGTYQSLDAGELAASFMVDGRPDPSSFRATVGAVLAAAGEGGRPVRVFGEMVAGLWDDGAVAAAIELETLWNDLRREQVFTLLCAYPVRSVEAVASLAPALAVCRQHSALIAPASYSTGGPDLDGRSGHVVRRFVPAPLAARAARRFVRETLEAWDAPELALEAELVSAELASNAVVHARSPFRMSLVRRLDGVLISVEDADVVGTPNVKPANGEDAGGRGMALVSGIAHSWGVHRSSDGKTVWAELRSSSSD